MQQVVLSYNYVDVYYRISVADVSCGPWQEQGYGRNRPVPTYILFWRCHGGLMVFDRSL